MKGIILAGGSGTRLHPVTLAISKQLLPVYDKPMIYYPLSTLMLAGINEVLIITTPQDQEQFKKLLSDGSQWGLKIEYATQAEPKGLPQAFTIGRHFIGDDNVMLILGDNILYKDALQYSLQQSIKLVEKQGGGVVFAYPVSDPERYGVIEFKEPNSNQVQSIEEKPKQPKSNYAAVGLYIFDNKVIQYAESLQPSARGELEITDVMKCYLEQDQLNAIPLGRGVAWLDMGTFDSLIDAASFVQILEKRQGKKIADLDEIAKLMGFLSA